ncbi:MAG: cupin domain-containing protein [Verrucomicrobiae bacterium]|nr:cupin domain-containing protein [Verrucomicrobiae bacterium]
MNDPMPSPSPSSPANLFENPPQDFSKEHILPLHKSGGSRIERIFSNGQASPPGFWYDQARDEWVLLAAGSASLEFDGGRMLDLKAGDHLLIPAHQKHRVAAVSRDAVWLAVHLGGSTAGD